MLNEVASNFDWRSYGLNDFKHYAIEHIALNSWLNIANAK